MVPIVFSSGHTFGARFLSGLLNSDSCKSGELSIAGVFALHPRHAPDISGYEDLGRLCSARNLRCQYFDRIADSSVLDVLIRLPHFYHVAVGLSQLLPQQLLDMPAAHAGYSGSYSAGHGCIGAHPTLLPEGRGRAPIPWTILKTRESTGVSVFFLDVAPDAGPIIAQQPISWNTTGSASELFDLVALGHEALGTRVAPYLAARRVPFHHQKEEMASVWEKRSRQHGWLDFRDDARNLERLVRAVSKPYPPAFFVIGATIVYVNQARAVSDSDATALPGTVVSVGTEHSFSIATGRGILEILDCDFWPDWIRITAGELIGPSNDHS